MKNKYLELKYSGLILALLMTMCMAVQGQSLERKARRAMSQTQRKTNRYVRDYKRIKNAVSKEKRSMTAEDIESDTISWTKDRYIPQEGLVNDYDYFFKAIHGDQKTIYFEPENKVEMISYDSINDVYYNLNSTITGIRDGKEVMGWYPYWNEEETVEFPYHLVTTIALFAYDVDPYTGAYRNEEAMNALKRSKVLSQADSNNIDLMLTVTSFGIENNDLFLDTPEAWTTLGDSLRSLITTMKLQGIDLYFDEFSENNSRRFTSFVNTLRKKIGPDKRLTLQLPPYNNFEVIDVESLSKAVDQFILQGFDYSYATCSGHPTSVAPLTAIGSDCPNIVNTFDYYLRKNIPASKMILGLPAYGVKWLVDRKGTEQSYTQLGYITYDDVVSLYEPNYQSVYEPVSGSSYYNIQKDGKSSELVWYESSVSLDTKVHWSYEHELKGVAIWALGYEGNHKSFWKPIEQVYGEAPFQELKPIHVDNGSTYSMVKQLVLHRKKIAVGFVITICFFVLGLLLSFLDWRVRDHFFRSNAYRMVFALVVIVLITIALFLNDPHINGKYLFFIGLVLGCGIVYLVTKWYMNYKRNLP